jgi:riboflavin kinase / FMN adenylyltransferase
VNKQTRIIRHLPSAFAAPACALTIGNLDGVHLGHQAMLAQVVAAARERGLCPSVLTFHPHPRRYFAQAQGLVDRAPGQINSMREKLTKIATQGIEQIVLLPFNQQMAQLDAHTFIEHLLVHQLGVKWLMVGPDFRFGRARAGDVALLRQASEALGFELSVLSQVSDDRGQRVSSSNVRLALQEGDMSRARELLGVPWRVSGHVIHGKKLGRTLGFPTLNMRVNAHTAARFGIYVVRVHGLCERPLPGIASLGVRPSVEDQLGVLLETHILGADICAYGKLVCVEFLQHVRDEKKFPDLKTLTDAMQRDRAHALEYFAHHGLQNNTEFD